MLTTAGQACRDDERLEIVYEASDGARSERRVEPHRLVSLGRRWYLVAYDLHRGGWRSFRLDRLQALRPDGTGFRQRALPLEDPAEFVRQGIRSRASTHEVSAVVHAPAEAVRSRSGRGRTSRTTGRAGAG